jgi:hypothetical protein
MPISHRPSCDRIGKRFARIVDRRPEGDPDFRHAVVSRRSGFRLLDTQALEEENEGEGFVTRTFAPASSPCYKAPGKHGKRTVSRAGSCYNA